MTHFATNAPMMAATLRPRMSEKAMAPVREMQMASDWVAAVLQLGRMVIMDMICLFVWGGVWVYGLWWIW